MKKGWEMQYTLFYSPDSANVVVRMVLETLGLPYQALEVDRRVGAQRSPEFLQHNPQGLLPVLLDPTQDEPLFETAAILLHLADQHAALPAPDAKRRCTFLKWLFFLSNTLHADLRVLFYSERYAPDPQAVPALRQVVRQRVCAHLRLLEAQILGHGGTWLLGQSLSVCDFYLAACIRWAQLYPRGDTLASIALAPYPGLRRLLQTLECRSEVQKAFAAEGMYGAVFTSPDYPTSAVV
jgi:glutathione S-transferase